MHEYLKGYGTEVVMLADTRKPSAGRGVRLDIANFVFVGVNPVL